MEILSEIRTAIRRLEGRVLRTPLLHAPALSKLCGGKVFLKMESEQRTGSFKLRGAFNKILFLEETGDGRPVITASTGNHGLGVARALRDTGKDGIIVVPENASEVKVNGLKVLGATVERHGRDSFAAETFARSRAEKEGWTYISPYNDPQVIGGQGTAAVEAVEQSANPFDNAFVTVGGGGLISGMGSWLKEHMPECRLYGCQPSRSPEMALSVQRREYTTVEPQETLWDGSAGAFERDAITYPLCRDLVDEFLLAEEKEISAGIRWALDHERKLIEGAAAVAIAPLLREPERWEGQTSLVVICGGNISREKLKTVLEHKDR